MGNKLPRPPREPLDPELTKVRGLYPSCTWDEHRVRRLINERRLAPCFVGAESDNQDATLEECPICMYFYPAMNRTTCCRKSICTGARVRAALRHSAPPSRPRPRRLITARPLAAPVRAGATTPPAPSRA